MSDACRRSKRSYPFNEAGGDGAADGACAHEHGILVDLL